MKMQLNIYLNKKECKLKDLHSFLLFFFLRKDRVMNLLSYILEIQFIIKMSMP